MLTVASPGQRHSGLGADGDIWKLRGLKEHA